eukprot:TRINITY_DN4262_c0_g1_i1.p1 TRINITY_DN4262_c0_g1~~TRINITY_DN4262_c0_g1_i1.p1  ORF type:complete len:577 (+),score=78.06 TRINITY_DN4262_c0_g1_i1:85-1815(+)
MPPKKSGRQQQKWWEPKQPEQTAEASADVPAESKSSSKAHPQAGRMSPGRSPQPPPERGSPPPQQQPAGRSPQPAAGRGSQPGARGPQAVGKQPPQRGQPAKRPPHAAPAPANSRQPRLGAPPGLGGGSCGGVQGGLALDSLAIMFKAASMANVLNAGKAKSQPPPPPGPGSGLPPGLSLAGMLPPPLTPLPPPGMGGLPGMPLMPLPGLGGMPPPFSSVSGCFPLAAPMPYSPMHPPPGMNGMMGMVGGGYPGSSSNGGHIHDKPHLTKSRNAAGDALKKFSVVEQVQRAERMAFASNGGGYADGYRRYPPVDPHSEFPLGLDPVAAEMDADMAEEYERRRRAAATEQAKATAARIDPALGARRRSSSPSRDGHSESQSSTRYTGRIRSYSEIHGFGFIGCSELYKSHGCDVFLNQEVEGGRIVGSLVSFTIELNKDGKPQARNVRLEDANTDEMGVDARKASLPDKGTRGGVYRGRVKSFNAKTGFGFLFCPQLHGMFNKDIFVSKAEVREGLIVGQEVEFTLVVNEKSEPQAYNIVKASNSTISMVTPAAPPNMSRDQRFARQPMWPPGMLDA